MKRQLAWIAGAMAATCVHGHATAQPVEDDPFSWRVEERFRLWTNAERGGEQTTPDALLDQVAGTVSSDTVYKAIRAFVNQQPELHRRSFWNPSAEQYALTYVFPKDYTVVIGLRDSAALRGRICTWSSSLGTFDQASAPCEQTVRLTLPAAPDASGSVAASVSAAAPSALTLTAPVRVRDRLIAGIGDSFAAGEGNPDQQARWGNLKNGPTGPWESEWETERWFGRQKAVSGFEPAQWWDPQCHRSFNSQQLTAALKYAADHPREAVTFVSYACSGAHILYGLLVTQTEPPGYNDSAKAKRLRLPQVEALVRNLCHPAKNGTSTARDRGTRTYRTEVIKPNGTREDHSPSATLAGCADDTQRRKVDALFVNIGGNDVGFAPVIFHGLLPNNGGAPIGVAMLNVLRNEFARPPGQASEYVLDILPPAFADLRQRLAEAFPEGPQVLQSEYPSPTGGDSGGLCGPLLQRAPGGFDHPDGLRLRSLTGIWPDKEVPQARRWRAMIDQAEGKSVEELLIGPLNKAVRDAATAGGWTYVSGYGSIFAKRGWCAGDGVIEQADFPEWNQAEGRFVNWNPADWDAYAPRMRLFRTPNDSALTLAMAEPRRRFGIASVIVRPYFGARQEGLLYSHAGLFHPTHEAHVIMGLATEEQMRLP